MSAASSFGWLTDLDDAEKLADEAGRLVLLDFVTGLNGCQAMGAATCPECRRRPGPWHSESAPGLR